MGIAWTRLSVRFGGVVTDDHGRANLLDFPAERRVEVNPPDLTAEHEGRLAANPELRLQPIPRRRALDRDPHSFPSAHLGFQAELDGRYYEGWWTAKNFKSCQELD